MCSVNYIPGIILGTFFAYIVIPMTLRWARRELQPRARRTRKP